MNPKVRATYDLSRSLLQGQEQEAPAQTEPECPDREATASDMIHSATTAIRRTDIGNLRSALDTRTVVSDEIVMQSDFKSQPTTGRGVFRLLKTIRGDAGVVTAMSARISSAKILAVALAWAAAGKRRACCPRNTGIAERATLRSLGAQRRVG